MKPHNNLIIKFFKKNNKPENGIYFLLPNEKKLLTLSVNNNAITSKYNIAVNTFDKNFYKLPLTEYKEINIVYLEKYLQFMCTHELLDRKLYNEIKRIKMLKFVKY